MGKYLADFAFSSFELWHVAGLTEGTLLLWFAAAGQMAGESQDRVMKMTRRSFRGQTGDTSVRHMTIVVCTVVDHLTSVKSLLNAHMNNSVLLSKSEYPPRHVKN